MWIMAVAVEEFRLGAGKWAQVSSDLARYHKNQKQGFLCLYAMLCVPFPPDLPAEKRDPKSTKPNLSPAPWTNAP